MSINIGPPVVDELKPKIAVIGVGGAGGNAIANMINARVEGVDFIVANTDAQALNSSPAEFRIQLGPDITQGLGAGSRPEVGRAAAARSDLAAKICRARADIRPAVPLGRLRRAPRRDRVLRQRSDAIPPSRSLPPRRAASCCPRATARNRGRRCGHGQAAA